MRLFTLPPLEGRVRVHIIIHTVLLLKSKLSPLCETQIPLFISDSMFIIGPSSAYPGTSGVHNNDALFFFFSFLFFFNNYARLIEESLKRMVANIHVCTCVQGNTLLFNNLMVSKTCKIFQKQLKDSFVGVTS